MCAATLNCGFNGLGPQLEVTIDADPAACAVRLPPMLVQPLVENAIKHGKTDRPLHLLVRARVRRGRLRVTVRDDGRGIVPRRDRAGCSSRASVEAPQKAIAPEVATEDLECLSDSFEEQVHSLIVEACYQLLWNFGGEQPPVKSEVKQCVDHFWYGRE